jgi:hypothetical protein
VTLSRAATGRIEDDRRSLLDSAHVRATGGRPTMGSFQNQRPSISRTCPKRAGCDVQPMQRSTTTPVELKLPRFRGRLTVGDVGRFPSIDLCLSRGSLQGTTPQARQP